MNYLISIIIIITYINIIKLYDENYFNKNNL